ncbi:MAG: type 1 fimbrial protein [Paraburkholderia sp.]|uniref:fimbrial protein n=1 Tax=Paraburkholderia sp. TaxID=1926495 RepID=UPI0011FF7FAF|nr:fimbrial protein [Paraburkholderia sp.]TAM03130.1 MAG: type 1 fimbrial protein [Paraburkholderia sp.]TAM27672.1 MAG: type 1 fimbrial protein [Paraburkholderia sp.]
MKKTLLSLVIAVAPISAAFAQSNNTIKFIGEVTDQTCNVAINGTTANPTVLLPAVSTAELDTSGKTAGKTDFTISVSGCTVSNTADQAIKTVFVGSKVSGGNLGNTAGGTNAATQVALQLFDPAKSGAPFDLSKPGGHTASGLNLKKGDTSASYDFAVQYISEGKATAGAVNGSVQYMVSYQ